MDQNERQIIEELFGKLRQAEAQSGPRDAQAEGFIREQVARQPAAPYLMAQAIVIQEQALAQSQARIQELEEQLRSRPAASSGGGGLFGSLFGGGTQQRQPAPPPSNSPWGNQGGQQQVGDPRVAALCQPAVPAASGRRLHGGRDADGHGRRGRHADRQRARQHVLRAARRWRRTPSMQVQEQVPEEFAADDGGDFFGGDEEF